MYSATSTAGYFMTRKIHYRCRAIRKDKKSFLIDPCSYIAGKEVHINVSGSKFRIHESYLNQYPNTLLGSSERNFFYDDKEKEFFFDRDPHIFRFIHKYYKTGKLHFSENDCYESFLDELKYFRIGPNHIATCCGDGYEVYLKQKEKRSKGCNREKKVRINTFRSACWDFCKNPSGSKAAKLFHILSCLVIVVSASSTCMETVDCNTHDDQKEIHDKCGVVYRSVFLAFDTFCVGFFTLEYLLRLYSTPNRLKFLKSKMSLIDVLAICPYFVDLMLTELDIVQGSTAVTILAALRTLHIVRVFKLTRHSKQLRVLSVAISKSLKDLGVIFFVYTVMVLIFGSIIYYFEKMSSMDTKLVNIPEALWYTVVTTTTLGYGDIVPSTIQGKFLGSLCCLMGVFLVALPVPIIQMKTEDYSEDEDEEI